MTLQASWRDGQLQRDALRSGLQTLARDLEMEIKVRFTEPRRRQRMAVLVTKEPHCCRKLLQAAKAGQLKGAEAALVLSNRSDLEAMASEAGLPFVKVA